MINTEDIRRRILFEDDHIIVIDKPAGLAVESASYTSPDLKSILRTYLGGRDIFVVHRLDQPVGGILVFGKTSAAAAALSAQLAGGMEKIYTARVSGEIPADRGTLENEISFDKKSGRAVVRDVEEGAGRGSPRGAAAWKRAKLSYEKKSDHELEIRLYTGRRHQIRAQLAHAGMPILGDVRYGGEPCDGSEGICLWASSLSFDHPADGRRMTFETDPDDGR